MNTAGTIFLPCVTVLIIFNVIYIQTTPNAIAIITTGALLTFFLAVLTVGIIGGIQILGSGVNTESLAIAFGSAMLLGVLFQIQLPWGGGVGLTWVTPDWAHPTGLIITSGATLPVGMGLATNLINAMPITSLGGIPFMFVTILTLVTFISGIIAFVTTGGE
jgi:hypothetical protein